MALLTGKYDPNAETTTVMPEHECVAQICESDCKPTAAGTGEYIALTWVILDGPHKDKKLWFNVNIKNPNKMAQDIGNAQFAAIRKALFGTKDKVINDTIELHDIPCRIKVGCQKRTDTGEMQNTIKKWTHLSESSTETKTDSAKKPF